MADELNLLPCPFCESPANLLLDEDDCPYVACASCHISQPAHRPGFEHMAIAAWNRRAAPAAAQLDADLPPLPKCAAYGIIGLTGLDPNDGHRQLSGVSVGKPGTWCKNSTVELYTAEQYREGQCQVAAQYAERIRLLTEELEAARGMVPSQMKVPGQSIGNDREFERLMVQWWVARESGGGIEEWRKAIAYIDGRTASTAGQMVRDLVKLWDSGNVSADEYNEAMCAIEDRMRAYAAAPSPLSGTEDAK